MSWEEPDLPCPPGWGKSIELRAGLRRHFPLWQREQRRQQREREIVSACCIAMLAVFVIALVLR